LAKCLIESLLLLIPALTIAETLPTIKKMKLFISLTLFLSIYFVGFTQEYPEYDIKVLDKVFNRRLNIININNDGNLTNITIDTNVINLAEKGIYIPTSINLYFTNLDSLIESNLNSLDVKQQTFIKKLKRDGLSSLSNKDYDKSKDIFLAISKNEKLRLCFYAVYDIELLTSSQDLIILDWKDEGIKFYSPTSDSLLFSNWKKKAIEQVTNNCDYGIGKYSYFIFNNKRLDAETYPKTITNDQYFRFYNNQWISQQIMGELNGSIGMEHYDEYEIIYAKVSFKCTDTVDCPENDNPFINQGWGSGGSDK
jgi:hypothetical protein